MKVLRVVNVSTPQQGSQIGIASAQNVRMIHKRRHCALAIGAFGRKMEIRCIRHVVHACPMRPNRDENELVTLSTQTFIDLK